MSGKKHIKGIEFFNALFANIENKVNNLSSAVTHGAPAIVGKNEDVITFLEK